MWIYSWGKYSFKRLIPCPHGNILPARRSINSTFIHFNFPLVHFPCVLTMGVESRDGGASPNSRIRGDVPPGLELGFLHVISVTCADSRKRALIGVSVFNDSQYDQSSPPSAVIVSPPPPPPVTIPWRRPLVPTATTIPQQIYKNSWHAESHHSTIEVNAFYGLNEEAIT